MFLSTDHKIAVFRHCYSLRVAHFLQNALVSFKKYIRQCHTLLAKHYVIRFVFRFFACALAPVLTLHRRFHFSPFYGTRLRCCRTAKWYL